MTRVPSPNCSSELDEIEDKPPADRTKETYVMDSQGDYIAASDILSDILRPSIDKPRGSLDSFIIERK